MAIKEVEVDTTRKKVKAHIKKVEIEEVTTSQEGVLVTTISIVGAESMKVVAEMKKTITNKRRNLIWLKEDSKLSRADRRRPKNHYLSMSQEVLDKLKVP